MAQQRETREVLNPALLEVGARPDVLIWRQTTGTFRAMDNPERVVKVGTPGMADAMMVVQVEVTPDMVGRKIGVAVAVEAKTLVGRQREAQKLWELAFTKRGGIYRLIRSAADILEVVRNVQAGNW